jgi:hypothetical protein
MTTNVVEDRLCKRNHGPSRVARQQKLVLTEKTPLHMLNGQGKLQSGSIESKYQDDSHLARKILWQYNDLVQDYTANNVCI